MKMRYGAAFIKKRPHKFNNIKNETDHMINNDGFIL